LSSPDISLKDLIAAAYGIDRYQISGGPSWVDSDQFEVTAKSPNAASREELLLMLRPLLSERFSLQFHSATKEMRVYALTVVKSDKLQRMKPGDESKAAFNRLGRNWDMSTLARYLTRLGADMPVIDKTGLSGTFNLDLDFEKIVALAAQTGGTPPSDGAMFQGAVEIMERDCGLKLAPTKALVEVLAIDRVNRPSAN
jgi:uncharacterized protein (TIGR03435 family)